jgi:hypothetical protein
MEIKISIKTVGDLRDYTVHTDLSIQATALIYCIATVTPDTPIEILKQTIKELNDFLQAS